MSGYQWFMLFRPIWPLAILVLYSYSANDWQKAWMAIFAALYMASTLLVSMFVDHDNWHEVRRITLLVEFAATILTAILLLWMWPLGPVSLLLLSSFVAYACLYDHDVWQWMMAFALLILYVANVRIALEQLTNIQFRTTITVVPILILVLYGAVLVCGTLLGYLIQRNRVEGRRLHDAMDRLEAQSDLLERVNQQLNDYAEHLYDLATAEERNRIAGEIHDTVAHRLTALLVQLQAARRRLGTERSAGGIENAVLNLEVCEGLARESLDDVRYSVRAIRRKAGSQGIDTLHRLAVHYASLTGMQIEFIPDPGLPTPPAQMVAVFYRALQEALTNAQRHGRATRVTIRLLLQTSYLCMEVTDNGKGSAELVHGFGLATMTERIRQLGGHVRVDTQPGEGYQLLVSLPMWEEMPS